MNIERARRVSPFSLYSFLTCREKLRLELEGWTPIERPANLQFGAVWHRFLQELDGFYMKHETPRKNEVLIALGVALSEEERWYGKNWSAELREQFLFLERMLEIIAPTYVEVWGDDFKKDRHWVEIESKVERAYGQFIMVGRIDRLSRDGHQRLVIHETKTKSRISNTDMSVFMQLDFQTMFYGFLLKEITGKSPSAVIRDIVRRPELRLGKTETIPHYCKRLGEDILKRPEHYFMRFRLPLLSSDLVEFRIHLDKILLAYSHWLSGAPEHHYRSTVNCYPGLFSCKFVNLCGSGKPVGYYQRKER